MSERQGPLFDESFISEPGRIILSKLRMLRDQYALDHLIDMYAYVKTFSGNEPERKVEVVSGQLRADETDFLTRRFINLFLPQEIEFKRKRSHEQTSLSFVLEYNKGIAQTVGEEGSKVTIHDASDIIKVAAHSGGAYVIHTSKRRGIYDSGATVKAISFEDLQNDRELLGDAMWDTFWRFPPIRS